MLPNSSSIYINPKFRNVHINPNFLSKSGNKILTDAVSPSNVPATVPTQIYINPKFLGKSTQGIAITQSTNSATTLTHPLENYPHLTAQEFHESISLVAEPLADTKIHTRTKIIKSSVNTKVLEPPMALEFRMNAIDSTKSLIKIGSKKLVRIPAKPSSFEKPSNSIPKLRRPLQTKYKIVKEQTAFKIDRRSAKAKLDSITRKITPIAPSRKLWINESLVPTKTVKK